MNNLRLFTLFLLLYLFVLSGIAAEDIDSDYYYYHGEKIAVEMNDSLLVLYYDSPEKGTYLENKYGLKPGRLEETDELGAVQISDCLIKCVYEVSPSEYKRTLKSIRNEENIVDVIRVVGKEHPVTITASFSIYLSDDATEEQARNLAAELGVEFIGYVGWGRWYQLRTNKNSAGDALVCSNLFYESGICREVDPAFGFRIIRNTVTDPGLVNQWAIDGVNNSTNRDIYAQDAWNITKGKSNIKVAIIDEGIRIEHPEFNTTNFVSSYDAYTGIEQHVYPYDPHGTSVTGIISSNHNSDSIAGVAPNLSIIEVSTVLDGSVSGVDSASIAEKMSNGILWAVRNGADILNCSWMLSDTDFHCVRIESAIDSALYYGRNGKGCVVVFASGNKKNVFPSDSVSYPARYNPDILVVGSIDKDGDISTFSKHGSQLDIVAPGEDILTTFYWKGVSGEPCHYFRCDGTSMSAAFVSAVAGLLLSENPNLTREQVVEHICCTAQRNINPNSYIYNKPFGNWSPLYGYGIVNALHTLYVEHSDMNNDVSNLYIKGCNVNVNNFENDGERVVVINAFSSVTLNGFFHIQSGDKLSVNAEGFDYFSYSGVPSCVF